MSGRRSAHQCIEKEFRCGLADKRNILKTSTKRLVCIETTKKSRNADQMQIMWKERKSGVRLSAHFQTQNIILVWCHKGTGDLQKCYVDDDAPVACSINLARIFMLFCALFFVGFSFIWRKTPNNNPFVGCNAQFQIVYNFIITWWNKTKEKKHVCSLLSPSPVIRLIHIIILWLVRCRWQATIDFFFLWCCGVLFNGKYAFNLITKLFFFSKKEGIHTRVRINSHHK